MLLHTVKLFCYTNQNEIVLAKTLVISNVEQFSEKVCFQSTLLLP